MEHEQGTGKGIFYSPALIAIVPVIAVIADYSLTFLLSGGREFILAYEASPLLRYAVEYDLVLVYSGALVLFYYLAAYLVLVLLRGSDLYAIGVALISLVSLTHFLGGLSWYFRQPLYSDTVIGLSLMCVIIALFLFAYSLSRGWGTMKKMENP